MRVNPSLWVFTFTYIFVIIKNSPKHVFDDFEIPIYVFDIYETPIKNFDTHPL